MNNTEMEFTPRQMQVIQFALFNGTASDIANQLGMKPGTLRKHLRDIYRLLKVSSRDELFWKICGKYQWRRGRLVRRPIIHRRYEVIKGGGEKNSNVKELVDIVQSAYSNDKSENNYSYLPIL